jgi:predicted phosphate transport protein (TIGR00153 family)
MFRLLPTETRFFDLFRDQANKVLEGAHALREMVEHYENIDEKARRIKQIESEGDELTHSLIDKLNRTFITPFDREDIHALASALDDVLDNIEGVASRLALFRVKSVTPEVIELVSVIVRSCVAIQAAILHLRDLKAIPPYLVKINDLENEADFISRNTTAQLFETASDFRELIKWKELYGRLEATTDDCEDVANILEGIVVKNN